ncbi:MAG: hypothetical protein H0U57_01330 [Tatlockia sp.]|nr:hypothetical protein [Tatlockia sp.]
MPKYILYLNSNGERFSCEVLNGLSLQDRNRLSELHPDCIFKNELMKLEKMGNIFVYGVPCLDPKRTPSICTYQVTPPQSIKEALSCKTRSDIESYIEQYLLNSREDEARNYFIYEKDASLTELVLYHAHFREELAVFKKHHNTIGEMHADTPKEMLKFVKNRSAFFQKNFTHGKIYQNTAWLDPSWLINCLGYYSTAFKNNLAYTFVGNYLLGMIPTHFCEDFNKGREQSDSIDNVGDRVNLAI